MSKFLKHDKYGHIVEDVKCPKCKKVREIRVNDNRKSDYCNTCKNTVATGNVFKHGDSDKELYSRWKGMKSRCLNPNNSKYSCYGAVGITVCDEWLEYIPFRDWSYANNYIENANPPIDLDRIDNNKGYSPDNCQWIDRYENQTKSKRSKIDD